MPQPFEHDVALARVLDALSSPTRIAILRTLRVPKAVGEVEVRSPERSAGALARQTVRQHLDRLAACDLVVARETERGYGVTTEFVLNHRALYALTEDLRGLARLRPAVELDGDTREQGAEKAFSARGPAFVVAKGLDEGAVHPLADDRDEWVLGRSRSCQIVLDYDPFVSGENAIVRRTPGGLVVQDIEGSRNGTRVNFVPLPRGGCAPLRHGDILGIGCSLLLHWA